MKAFIFPLAIMMAAGALQSAGAQETPTPNPLLPQVVARAPGAVLGPNLNDYLACINACTGLTDAEERKICMEGCSSIESSFSARPGAEIERAGPQVFVIR